VRRAVIAAISTGDPTIDNVAGRLGQSVRSLQRRLQADRSFKELVEETRLDLAQRYLADPELTLTETAFLLGYSDLSAFSRAFKRWTGKTALDVRRANQTEPTGGSSRRKTKTP
jgi:AraC-like DNA-binding protein